MPDESVIDRATGEFCRSGFFDQLKVFTFVQGDKCKVFADVAEEEERCVTAHASFAGHASEGGVDVGKTMRSATNVLAAKTKKKIEACGMVLMIAVKRGNEHRGVKKCFHLVSPAR